MTAGVRRRRAAPVTGESSKSGTSSHLVAVDLVVAPACCADRQGDPNVIVDLEDPDITAAAARPSNIGYQVDGAAWLDDGRRSS